MLRFLFPIAIVLTVRLTLAADYSSQQEKIDAVVADALRARDMISDLFNVTGRLPGEREINRLRTSSGLIDTASWNGRFIWIVADSDETGLTLTLTPEVDSSQKLTWACRSLGNAPGIPHDCTSEMNLRSYRQLQARGINIQSVDPDSPEAAISSILRLTVFPRNLIGEYYVVNGRLPTRDDVPVIAVDSELVTRVSWTGSYLWMMFSHELLEKDVVLRMAPELVGGGGIRWQCVSLADIAGLPADCSEVLPLVITLQAAPSP